MTAYYNENNSFAAAWLRELIADNLIAPGEVDERSIEDVTPNDLRPFRQCHFFAGIGVWSLAARRAGWDDDAPLWSGSCPCQPFSAAGKGGRFADERHLWPAFHYLIEQCQPDLVVGEQSGGAGGEAWIDLVSADLDATGYDCGAVVTCAAGFGAPHNRPRTYWVAHAKRRQRRQESYGWPIGRVGRKQQSVPWDCHWQTALSELRVLDDGHPRCVGGSDAFRNAVTLGQAEGFLVAVRESLVA